MLNYKDYEKAVFDWLMAKNKISGFTFGLRRVASNGAEKDYFIGKEVSHYFGTTFWTIPVSFPGSSGDLIQLIFQYTSNKKELIYFFECNQTKEPNSPQNQYALELIQNLKDPLEQKFGLKRAFNPNAKMYNFQIKPIKVSYENIDAMLKDVDIHLFDFINIVDKHINSLKSKYPDFKADKITGEDFKINLNKTYKRIEKYSVTGGDNPEIINNYSISKELFDIVHANLKLSKHYFSGLDAIIVKIDLKSNDQRVYYNYRKDTLIFGIGQRYVWCIDNKKNYLRYISKTPTEAVYEPFEKGKEAYLNSTHDFSRQDILDLTIAPIQETLASTAVSGFLRYNKSDFEKMVFDKEFRQAVFDKTIHVFEKDLINHEHDMSTTLNQILYGPPGTGKTYHTINKALAIIESKPIESIIQEKREVLKARFKDYVDAGQIVFTTFHQSMSYEDFVEGIKPLIEEDNEGNKQVVYDVKAGILKQLVGNIRLQKKNTSFTKNYSFDDAWNELLELVNEASNKELEYKLDILTPNLGMLVKDITSNGNLTLKPSKGGLKEYVVSYTRAKKLQEAFPDLSLVKNIDKEFRAVVGGLNSTAYWSVINFINTKIAANTQEGIKNDKEIKKNYVLIIDEINRGNVSAIFGEMITLIEDSKREGKEEALEVTLPYSKEKFSVPSNLHIIGTMNTADRSVESLDTALRRRFVFEEMLPITDLEELTYDIFDYTAGDVLRRINMRIEKLIDRDHCIGHAYFIGKNEETIIDSFYKNIIPLLQEYFFGDYGKIGLVLGKGFVRLKKEEKNIFADFDYDYVDDLESKPIYEIIDYRNHNEEFLSFEQAIQDLMH
ncbi:McrB family protein [Sphingobacterium sp. NPDC055346]